MITTLVLLCALSMQFQDAGAQADTEALVRRIKTNLAEVDEALIEASEVEVVTDEVARARRLHLEVIRDIDALIKSLEYRFSNPPPSGGGGGGSSSQAPPRSQPQSRPSDGSSSRPDDAPSPPSGESEEAQQGEQPGGEQPEGSPSEQRSGGTPPPDPTDDFTRNDTDGRWGLLPPKLQEQLQNLHVDDVPERYRGWLDAYIKAMRRLEQP